MTVLDRYFALSDLAGHEEEAFQELLSLFSDDAVLRTLQGTEIEGKEKIGQFFREFFTRNVEMHHLWTTQTIPNGLKTEWAVVGRRKDGSLFALKGFDVAQLDQEGKIRRLEVNLEKDVL